MMSVLLALPLWLQRLRGLQWQQWLPQRPRLPAAVALADLGFSAVVSLLVRFSWILASVADVKALQRNTAVACPLDKG